MSLTLTPDIWSRLFDEVRKRLDDLENTSPLANASATAGTTRWKDGSNVDQVMVGLESDGSYGVWIGNGGVIRLVASGILTIPDHNSSNVPTVTPTGVKIFVQSSDPGGAAQNNDIWINTT